MIFLNVSIIIILIIIILFIIYYFNTVGNILYDKLLDTNNKTTTLNDATIKYSDNRLSLSNITSNFAISVWFYIDQFNSTNDDKVILYTADSNNKYANDYDLKISMDAYKNNLKINLRQLSSESTPTDNVIQEYHVKNIHIQKWNCLTISVDSHIMDVYMNGKLVNSFLINTMFTPNSSEPSIYLGYSNNQDGYTAIHGYITRVRYYTTYLSSQDAYNIYKEGISQSILNKISNNYNIKVSLMENGIDKAGFTI